MWVCELWTSDNMLPNDNVSMSVGHLDHVLIAVNCHVPCFEEGLAT